MMKILNILLCIQLLAFSSYAVSNVGFGNSFTDGDLTSLVVTDDSDDLIITVQGTLTSSYQIFINMDDNENTGFADGTWTDMGADYLVEAGVLYTYSGIAGDWGWTSAGGVTVTNPSGSERVISISRDDINMPSIFSGSNISVGYKSIDGGVSDFLPDTSSMLDYTIISDAELISIDVTKDATNLYVTITGSSFEVGWDLYINADGNSSTGFNSFAFPTSSGADYLMQQGGGLFNFTGADQNTYGWGFVGGASSSTSATEIIATIPLASVTLGSNIAVGFIGTTTSTTWIPTDGAFKSHSIATHIWDGSTWFEDTPTASDDVRIDASYSSGTLSTADLTINYGAVFTISNGEVLTVNGDLVNNGSILIESGGSLITYDANSIVGKAITFERDTRYSDGKYSFVGTPVEQYASIVGSDLGDYVHRYNEETSYGSDGTARWEEIITDQLIPGKGYTQAFQQEIVFSGTPNTGTITYSGTYTGVYNDGSNESTEGWNLVSNPYTAAISVASFLSENSSNLEGAVYLWDDNGSSGGQGSNSDYIIANGTMATNTTPAGGQTRYNQHLGSTQGFFVKLDDDSDTDITFTETMRVAGSNSDNNYFRKTEFPIVRINLTNSKGIFKQSVIGFANDATAKKMNKVYDAPAFNSSVNNGLFTVKAGRTLALNGMPNDWEVVQLQLNTAEAGLYQISIEIENFNQSIFLLDNQTGKVIDLQNEEYSFSAEPGINVDRFQLITDPNTVLGLKEKNSFLYVSEKVLHIQQFDKVTREYQLFNMKGKQLLNTSVKSNKEINLSAYSAGIYLVFDGTQTHKIILE